MAIGLRRWNDRHTGSRGAVEPLVWIPALALFAAIWPMFGWFVVAVVVSGADPFTPSTPILAPGMNDSETSLSTVLSGGCVRPSLYMVKMY